MGQLSLFTNIAPKLIIFELDYFPYITNIALLISHLLRSTILIIINIAAGKHGLSQRQTTFLALL